MSLLELCQWLAATPASIALRESHYLYLAVLATHVLTLGVFLGTALIIDLRLLGLAMRSVPVSEFLSRLLPWTVGGFVVMVASGSLMFFAAPVDKYANLFFRAKMGLLLLAGITAWLFYRTVRRRIGEWDRDPVPPAAARLTGGLSLVFWIAILVAGRMIPYQQYWF
ncbi:DUF6644 family protein [Candidatus Rariloculus sp.]|uniref:DUF6644 family protein n=1 Tax=Candidatus Rariloculus sp. TaxID=3101265 RepID=UPI003D11446A